MGICTATLAHSPTRSENCPLKKEPPFDVLMNVIEKISAVALGVFSAYTCLELFVPAFFFGVCVGIYSYIQDEKSCNHGHSGSSCAQGLLEQLTGVKLPRTVSLAANIAVTVCHIDHHATVFVPVTGVSLGAWVGKMASHYGELAQKKISCHFDKRQCSPHPVRS